jgi:cysteine desulfuration protein SufE
LDLSPELRSFDIHMAFTSRQHALAEELMTLEDPRDRLQAVVDRARNTPRFSELERIASHRVAGCRTDVWLIAEMRNGRCYFRSDAESPLVRGLVELLTVFYSGATAAEIGATEADPLVTLDLARTLSSTRQHGLAAVQLAIRAFATKQLTARAETSEPV